MSNPRSSKRLQNVRLKRAGRDRQSSAPSNIPNRRGGLAATSSGLHFEARGETVTQNNLRDTARQIVMRGGTYYEGNLAQEVRLNLPVVESAAFGSFVDQHEPECLEGTRVDLLKTIYSWSDDPQGKGIFWLVGRAGTGKSTISRTVARNLRTSNQLAASFFFNRNEHDRSNSIRLFTTIASQLADYDRCCIGAQIQNASEENRDISGKSLEEQFRTLILEPLSAVKPLPSCTRRSARLILVIDALDECNGTGEIKIIINQFARLKGVRPAVDIRVFLTSRPDLPICATFEKLPDGIYKDVILHNVAGIEHDISLFLHQELSRIRDERKLADIEPVSWLDPSKLPPQKWPGERRLWMLVKMAVPLFIYAATLCRFIGDENWDPEERIQGILQYQSDCRLSQLSQLQKTYLPILDKITTYPGQNEAEKKRLIDEFRQILGTIVNLATPLSASGLAGLLCISQNIVNCRLRLLHSVLDVPKDIHAPIRTFHLSFHDFLLDSSLQESPFRVDEEEFHRMIADKCIEQMSRPGGLEMDMCRLGQPGRLCLDIDKDIIEKRFPSELRYACRYWVYHLKRARSGRCLVDNDQTHVFLQKHLLHWLEANSLIDVNLWPTIEALDELISMIDAEHGKSISAFVYDMRRFVQVNDTIISGAPLQTYYLALLFAPNRSPIRCKFKLGEIEWTGQLPRIQCMALHGHTSLVYSVAFSPDGKMVASASHDKTTKLWDATTGAELSTLRGHTSWVNDVAFSSDGVVASGSNDQTVKLWDVATGAELSTLRGHTGPVNNVGFSPGGKTVASVSRDKTVKLWDAATGAELSTLRGHMSWVDSIAVSPDGKMVVSASNDKTIKLWDVATGETLNVFTSCNYPGKLQFSEDGRYINTNTQSFPIAVTSVPADSHAHQNGDQLESLFVDDKWLVRGSEKLIWLPYGYSDSSSASYANTIVLGRDSGDISLIKFII